MESRRVFACVSVRGHARSQAPTATGSNINPAPRRPDEFGRIERAHTRHSSEYIQSDAHLSIQSGVDALVHGAPLVPRPQLPPLHLHFLSSPFFSLLSSLRSLGGNKASPVHMLQGAPESHFTLAQIGRKRTKATRTALAS